MNKEDITFSILALPLLLTSCLEEEVVEPSRVFFASPHALPRLRGWRRARAGVSVGNSFLRVLN